MTTLDQLVERTRANLTQGGMNVPQLATFNGWVLNGSGSPIGLQLADVGDPDALARSHVEIGTELVYVQSYDANSGVATCPAWFRQRMGSPANASAAVGNMVTINPRWATWTVSQALLDGIRACEPDLFAVKTTTLTSSPVSVRYLLPSDVEDILTLKVLLPGSTDSELPVKRWSLDTKATDGNRYLHMPCLGMSGLNIYVTYRSKATIPAATAMSGLTWASTGLPASAEGLPVLHATASLLPQAEATRTQTSSIEQSDRAKYIQTGSATSTSRFWMQEFEAGLVRERRALLDKFSARPHFQMNG
jgi:hypothetical protein